jgi:hypothetical protein
MPGKVEGAMLLNCTSWPKNRTWYDDFFGEGSSAEVGRLLSSPRTVDGGDGRVRNVALVLAPPDEGTSGIREKEPFFTKND